MQTPYFASYQSRGLLPQVKGAETGKRVPSKDTFHVYRSIEIYLLFSHRNVLCFLLETNRTPIMGKTDVLQGTLALMVLKTLEVLGPLHGYGIARRIEQISGDLLAVNQGTLYPVLLKLEHEGVIVSEWGASENNRRARFYRLTRAGRKRVEAEALEWERTTAIIAQFFSIKAENRS